jgi:hypothetical protein
MTQYKDIGFEEFRKKASDRCSLFFTKAFKSPWGGISKVRRAVIYT